MQLSPEQYAELREDIKEIKVTLALHLRHHNGRGRFPLYVLPIGGLGTGIGLSIAAIMKLVGG